MLLTILIFSGEVLQSNCWDTIKSGSNEIEGKLSRGSYVKNIYLGFFVHGLLFGWQLFRGNYRWSLILRDNSLNASCQSVIIWGEEQFGGGGGGG